jgi:uncharacterized protein (UPF0248 family)
MEPIRELLSRIRWDDEFGRGDFEIGIYDRVEDAVHFHPIDQIHIEKENHSCLKVCVAGMILTIPFHRIREVRKDGESIWRRESAQDA